MKTVISLMAISFLLSSAMAGTEVRDTRQYSDDKTDLTILSALVELPADGRWQMAEAPSAGIADVYLTPTKEAQDRLKGKRYQFEIDKHKKRSDLRVLRDLPVAEIEGVTVESHPYGEMLGDSEGGRLEIAELIPKDRFLAYLTKPQSRQQFLDGGSDFIFRVGSSFTGHCLERNLVERYLAKMGMPETWLRTFLKVGAVDEVTVAMPDLFVIDGTEFTAVARLKSATLAEPLLKMLGIDDLEGETVREPRSRWTSFLGAQGRLSHCQHPSRRIRESPGFACQPWPRQSGENSLGRSEEFRYMLTQQPIEDQTGMYVYFSDPFIRRMVGPEIKIGQLRRLQARFESESITRGNG